MCMSYSYTYITFMVIYYTICYVLFSCTIIMYCYHVLSSCTIFTYCYHVLCSCTNFIYYIHVLFHVLCTFHILSYFIYCHLVLFIYYIIILTFQIILHSYTFSYIMSDRIILCYRTYHHIVVLCLSDHIISFHMSYSNHLFYVSCLHKP